MIFIFMWSSDVVQRPVLWDGCSRLGSCAVLLGSIR